jgi:hypothetical protein
MALFKTTQDQSNLTFEKIRSSLYVQSKDTSQYQIVYAQRTQVRTYIVATTTTIYHYVFGYTPNFEKFFIASIYKNGNIVAVTQPHFFLRSEILTAKRKFNTTIKLKLADGKILRFSVPAYTVKNSPYPVLQEAAAKQLNDFMKNFVR